MTAMRMMKEGAAETAGLRVLTLYGRDGFCAVHKSWHQPRVGDRLGDGAAAASAYNGPGRGAPDDVAADRRAGEARAASSGSLWKRQVVAQDASHGDWNRYDGDSAREGGLERERWQSEAEADRWNRWHDDSHWEQQQQRGEAAQRSWNCQQWEHGSGDDRRYRRQGEGDGRRDQQQQQQQGEPAQRQWYGQQWRCPEQSWLDEDPAARGCWEPESSDDRLRRRQNEDAAAPRRPVPPPAAAAAPADDRTTLILRNLPNDLTRDMLIQLLETKGFAHEFNFLYVPVDFRQWAGRGYAFVNAVSNADAMRMRRHLDGFTEWGMPSKKELKVAWAQVQGLEANVERYRNSSVMHDCVPEGVKPLLFVNSCRCPLPAPTKLLRMPNLVRAPQSSTSGGAARAA